jgi:hypothetical protein
MKPKQVVLRVSRVILGLFFVMDGVIKLTLLCHLRRGGFRTKLTIRLNNLRLPSK